MNTVNNGRKGFNKAGKIEWGQDREGSIMAAEATELPTSHFQVLGVN